MPDPESDSPLEVDVQFAHDFPGFPEARKLAEWARACWAGTEASVSIRVADEAESQALNARYRGRDHPTNVLSFPCDPLPGVPGLLLGDLVVCAPVVEREARAQGKSVEAHAAHMVVHGMLHLLGHDHDTEAEACAMEAKERAILGRLGFSDPYAEERDPPVAGTRPGPEDQGMKG